MARNFQFRPDRRGAPILASALVLFLGAIATTVVALSSGQNPYISLAIFAALAVIVPVTGYVLRARPQQTLSSLYGWIQGTKSKSGDDYQPRARRSRVNYGNNAPPSADDIRDLREGTNNWVPSNVPPRPKKPRP